MATPSPVEKAQDKQRTSRKLTWNSPVTLTGSWVGVGTGGAGLGRL